MGQSEVEIIVVSINKTKSAFGSSPMNPSQFLKGGSKTWRNVLVGFPQEESCHKDSFDGADLKVLPQGPWCVCVCQKEKRLMRM